MLADDEPAEIVERARAVPSTPPFLLVDDAGQPAGVLRRDDMLAVLQPATRRARRTTLRASRRGRVNRDFRPGTGCS